MLFRSDGTEFFLGPAAVCFGRVPAVAAAGEGDSVLNETDVHRRERPERLAGARWFKYTDKNGMPGTAVPAFHFFIL